MKKYRFLTVAFICMAIFLMLPSVINAEETDYKYLCILWGEDIYIEENGEVILDETEQFGLEYNKATNTLTLNNYKGSPLSYDMGDDFKVEILGENIVYPAIDEKSTFSCISGDGNIEFIGDGKLTLDSGIISTGTNDLAKRPITGEPLWVDSEGDLVINGPEINIKTAYSPIYTYGFEMKKGTLNIKVEDDQPGLSAHRKIIVSGGNINIDCGPEAMFGIFGVDITGGNVKIKTTSYGIGSSKDINITGGTIDIDAEDLTMVPGGKIILGENMGITDSNLIVYEYEFEDMKLSRIVDKTTKQLAKKVTIVEYEYTDESKNQQIEGEKEGTLTFTINADYEAFKNGGKVFIDGKELASEHYTSKSGSTIITLNEDYAKSLENGKHEITVQFGNGAKVTTNFTVINKTVEKEEETLPPEVNGGTTDKEPVEKPGTNAGAIGDSESVPAIKDETPNTGRQDVNMQAIIAVVMLGVVGVVVVSKRRA